MCSVRPVSAPATPRTARSSRTPAIAIVFTITAGITIMNIVIITSIIIVSIIIIVIISINISIIVRTVSVIVLT